MEICIDDLDGALVAEQAGAHRVELCADLLEGGTTPSIGLLSAVIQSTSLVGVRVMVRPRGGDFVYNEGELDVMCRDLAEIRAVVAAAAGAAGRVGVVLGALTPEGGVDVAALRQLMDAAGELPVTFHKAFDETPDLLESYEILAELGVVAILSSGGETTAEQGSAALARLVARSAAAPGPRMLAGGGVRPSNVGALLASTGASEVHLRAQTPSPRGDGTLRTDPELVARMLAAVADGSAGAGGPAAADDAPAGSDREPAPPRDAVLALDIGGTNLKGAVVDERGRIVLAETVDAGTDGSGGNGAESLERVRALLVQLQGHATAAGWNVIGAGVVTPGIIEPATGVVRYASTLGWTDVPLGALLAGDLGVPVAIGHDVRAAGLAEALFGAAAGVSNSVLVAIGTGVAAAILSSDTEVAGHLTSAGELGHIPALPQGESCTCGQRGCLEVYMSGAGLARRYLALGGAEPLTAADIVDRLATDPLAARVWSDGVEALTLGLKTATMLLDPAVIVLTGGVSRAGDALLDPVREQLAASLTWRSAPPVETSVLGTSGSRIGASVLAFRAAGRMHAPDRWMLDELLAQPVGPRASLAAHSLET
ncbi:copper homeostasis protein CutC [Subtercola boreus]|uniref:copper homeostasis protein CutC n=1 Tax=Subtercola boreus TaxID=120213 RepID=UPI001C0EDA25|nr:copper homeostasis protein CutC [Subtercola boreus]